jgi:Zn finger protein HypA/HybF involved in hydrogenase expression
MSQLKDEPFEKMADDKELEAVLAVEKVWGTVQCNECRYWGRMDGYIQPDNKKIIQFVCPECSAVEQVRNPEAL